MKLWGALKPLCQKKWSTLYYIVVSEVGRNKAIFSSSDYDHICNDRILTIKSEFTLRPYFNILNLDSDHKKWQFGFWTYKDKMSSENSYYLFRTMKTTILVYCGDILILYYISVSRLYIYTWRHALHCIEKTELNIPDVHQFFRHGGFKNYDNFMVSIFEEDVKIQSGH